MSGQKRTNLLPFSDDSLRICPHSVMRCDLKTVNLSICGVSQIYPHYQCLVDTSVSGLVNVVMKV